MSKPPFSKKRKGKTVEAYPLGAKEKKSKTKQTKKNRGRPRKAMTSTPVGPAANKDLGKMLETKEPQAFTGSNGLRRYVAVGLSKKEFRQVVSADGGNRFSANWVKKRVGTSGNKTDIELANAYPGKIIRYNPTMYGSGALESYGYEDRQSIEILDPHDYGWTEIRGFKLFLKKSPKGKKKGKKVRGEEALRLFQEGVEAERQYSEGKEKKARGPGKPAARVRKSKVYKETVASLLEKHSKKELRKMYRLKYGSAPRLSKKEYAEQLAVSAYSGSGPKLSKKTVSDGRGMKDAPVVVKEERLYDGVTLGQKGTEDYAILMSKDKKRLLSEYQILHKVTSADKKTSKSSLASGILEAQYGEKVFDAMDEYQILLRKEKRKQRRLKKKGEKKPSKKPKETGPSRKDIERVLKDDWGWKGSAKMFKRAVEDYYKAVREGTWAYKNGTLVEKKSKKKRSYLGFTVPARGAEKYDPLPLSPGVSPIRAASEKEALELHAKALNIQRYKIRDGYLYYTADNKRMRLQVRRG